MNQRDIDIMHIEAENYLASIREEFQRSMMGNRGTNGETELGRYRERQGTPGSALGTDGSGRGMESQAQYGGNPAGTNDRPTG
jgi:hypothetical protein